MNMGMYTELGNSKVSAIVTRVRGLELANDAAWKYAYRELDALSETPGTEEATDTEVREALWEELLKQGVINDIEAVDYWFYIGELVF